MARATASADRLVGHLRPHVRDERVLAAIAAVPRDLFVPASLADAAWANTALPIGAGQTISQPVVVARMCELLELRGDERVLDVGTGSGYHAAVLAKLAREVWSIEREERLSRGAASALAVAVLRRVDVGVHVACALVQLASPFGLGARAVRALLGLRRLTPGPGSLL